MMRSMTGFASALRSTDRYDIFMELKSVNSRYFEFKARTSFFLSELELELRNKLFVRLERGKIDLFIKVVEKNAENYDFVVNTELAMQYEQALKELCGNLSVKPEISLQDILRLDGVLSLERTGTDPELDKMILEMLDELIDKIIVMMDIEGKKTAEDINKSLNAIIQSVEIIEQNYPQSLENFRKAMAERIAEFDRKGMDEKRLLMEVELVASRTAINEEIVRLYSHIRQVKNILDGSALGDSKKLDFISQELNREANTIASKSADYRIIEQTIQIKSEIEKIREQLRNIG